MIIYTDRPLDSIFESLPPLENPVKPILGLPLPLQYCSRLKFGAMEFIDWTPVERTRLKDYGPRDCVWWAYFYNCPNSHVWESQYPNRDKNCHLITYDLLFVYWYLGNVGDKLAIAFNECMCSDEVPVAYIDISRYGVGSRPLSGYRRSGVMYVFTDSQKTARLHDTSILEIAASHKNTGDYLWRSIRDSTTLRELISLCGNAISRVALFEQGASISSELPFSIPMCGEIPVPFAVVSVDSCESTLSNYLDRQVISYSLYCKDSMSFCKIPCIGNEIGIAVILQDTLGNIGRD